MTVRGGGNPMDSMANNAVAQNGPAASELRCRCVLVHHGLGLGPAAYKDVARSFVHHARAPLEFVIPTITSVAVVLGAVKDKPLRVALRAILDRSCARRATRMCAGRDEETAAKPNKETQGRENG